MQIDFITDIPKYRANRFPNARFVEWVGESKHITTAQDFLKLISNYTHSFLQLRIKPNTRVSTFSSCTRVNMLAAEFALMQLGVSVCPMHTSQNAEDAERYIRNLAPEYCIIAGDKTQSLEQIIGGIDSGISILKLNALPTNGSQIEPTYIANQDAPALIISTSGTSGNPKGVVLTHRNIVSAAMAGAAVIPINSKHVVLSFLPTSHILERIAMYCEMLLGTEIHFTELPRHAYLLMSRIKPHYFSGVPRNLERTFARFKYASEQKGFFSRQIFEWSLKQKKGNSIVTLIVRWFVLSKLKRIFGRGIKGIIVGGAAMNPDIIRWFNLAGIKVREGYGLSETSGIVSLNHFSPGEYKMGTAGRAVPGVEIRIEPFDGSQYGQIMVRGSCLFSGYLINGVFSKINTKDGWFATGDTGEIDNEGFLTIKGRIKDNFKNSFGQYVSPAPIEQNIEFEIGVDRAMVIGLKQPFTSALIRPDFEFLQTWSKENHVHWTAAEYMVHNPDILNYYQNRIDLINNRLPVHARILGFALIAEEWTIDNGLLTPTLKLRREIILEKFNKVVKGIYS